MERKKSALWAFFRSRKEKIFTSYYGIWDFKQKRQKLEATKAAEKFPFSAVASVASSPLIQTGSSDEVKRGRRKVVLSR